MNDADVRICQTYAEMLCLQRKAEELRHSINRQLLTTEPVEALPHLDMIKKVMEIDETVTDPAVVLQRASIPVSPQ